MLLILIHAAHADPLWLDPAAKPHPIELLPGDELLVDLDDPALDLWAWELEVDGERYALAEVLEPVLDEEEPVVSVKPASSAHGKGYNVTNFVLDIDGEMSRYL